MAKKVLVALDLAQNELQNARIQNLAAAPGSPVTGQVWYNSTTGRIEFRGASAAIDPTARANHTGTQLAATVSDLAATVQAYRLDQFAVPTNPVSFNSQRATNLATPTSAADACTKAYADAITTSIPTYRLDQFAAPTAPVNLNSQKVTNLANGTATGDAINFGQLQTAINGTDWKPSVRAATTANITLSGTQTVDGVALVATNRCLVKNQSTPAQNGIYVVAAGAWTRATDADVGVLTASAAVFVEEGTTQADTQWRLTTDDPITVGTTAIAWTQIGAAVSYTGSAGVSLVGNDFRLDTAVAVRKYAQTFGDGSALSYPITHGLGTLDVTIGVYQVSDGAEVECDKTRTSTSISTLAFAVAPATNALRVVIHG